MSHPPCLRSFEEVCKTLAHAKKDLGEVLSAVEFVDRKALTLVLEHVEVSGSDAQVVVLCGLTPLSLYNREPKIHWLNPIRSTCS